MRCRSTSIASCQGCPSSDRFLLSCQTSIFRRSFGKRLHYYYDVNHTSTQVGACRTIKNIPNLGMVEDIAYWQTTGSGDFTNPSPPIICGPHNLYYQLHVYVSEYQSAPGAPNSAEDWKDATALQL